MNAKAKFKKIVAILAVSIMILSAFIFMACDNDNDNDNDNDYDCECYCFCEKNLVYPNEATHFDFTILDSCTQYGQLQDAKNRPDLYHGKTVLIRGTYPVGAIVQGVIVHRLHVRCRQHNIEIYINLVQHSGEFPHVADEVGMHSVEIRGTFTLESERFFIHLDAINGIRRLL